MEISYVDMIDTNLGVFVSVYMCVCGTRLSHFFLGAYLQDMKGEKTRIMASSHSQQGDHNKYGRRL